MFSAVHSKILGELDLGYIPFRFPYLVGRVLYHFAFRGGVSCISANLALLGAQIAP